MIDGAVGVLGGTGKQGSALARRFLAGGLEVLIGSRTAEKGAAVAAEVGCEGGTNAEVAARAELVVATLPYQGVADTVEPLAGALAGKVVVSPINALAFDARGPHPVAVPAGSAAEELAGLLPDARVATGFNSISAVELRVDEPLDQDVLICADDDHTAALATALVDRVEGLRGVYVGPLRLAAVVEDLTAVILSVNRRRKVTAGIRVTGI